MSVMQQARHKAGDTLTWVCARIDAAGNPVPVGSNVKACFATLGALSVDVPDPLGNTFTIMADAAVTAGWTPGVYRGDVTFTGVGVESTDTYMLIVDTGYVC